MIRYVVVLLGVVAAGSLTAQEVFDLGGPCIDVGGFSSRGIPAAAKAGDWERVIDLEKANVRAGCRIAYRWQKLADDFVQARRSSDAISVIAEMERRNLNLNIGSMGLLPSVAAFMETARFRASPVGLKLEKLRKVSDGRRVRFQKLLASLPAGRRPPVDYIAKGACPFECCRYGKWTARQDTDLVSAPGSARVVGKLKRGASATALTGEVHLAPEPVVVVGGELPKDTLAFILDYQGEGFGNVYTEGKIVSMFVGTGKYCFQPMETCWAETLLPAAKKTKAVWWVKIRLQNGVTGWTTKTQNFDGKDACG